MKKLLLSVAIASALGLSGCGGDSVEDIKADVIESGETQLPLSRVVFDPANGGVSVPNDLLLSVSIDESALAAAQAANDETEVSRLTLQALSLQDGTLNIPSETVEAGETINYYDPSTAIGALDGWSTIAPMSLDIDLVDGVTLDSTSASQPGVVRIFEATLGGPLSADVDCQAEDSLTACKMGAELTFGVDFITTTSGNSLVVVPIKPLKAKQGYVLAITNTLMDSNGNSIAPSTTYESVRLDVETLPLPLESQLTVQTIINSYEDGLGESGVDTDTVIYSAGFTTQSTMDVLATAKLSMQVNSPILSSFTNNGYNVGQALAGSGAIDLTTDAGTSAFTSAQRADVYSSTLFAAHYLDIPTADNCILTTELPSPTTENCPSLYSYFTAMGDSPITVLGALSTGVLSLESFAATYATQAPSFGRADVYDGNTANLVGLNFGLDSQKHLTKFNPLPQAKSVAEIPVTITAPNLTNVNAIRTAQGRDLLTMPTSGWPVVIYQHGITTTKETLFAFAGAMADAGVVVVAIDHPLHGERVGEMTAASGLVVPIGASDTDIANPFDATSTLTIDGVPTAYLNLASLLTARDNLRQSELDILALRFALNAMSNDDALNIDPTDVSFFGHSLGGIAGVTAVAVANEPTISPLTGTALETNPYAMDVASFFAPGGGVPGFLLESPSFSGLVQSGLTSSDTFQATLVEAAASQGITQEALASLEASGSPQYDALVDAVYGPFAAVFNFAAQTILDASDPINYASTIAANTRALHVMEIVGDDVNLPDQVIPNSTQNSALSGTDPLVAYMGLPEVSTTTVDADGVKALVRFTDGNHGSILTTTVAEGSGNTVEGNTAVLIEMQTQLATFMATKGTTVLISNDAVVKQ